MGTLTNIEDLQCPAVLAVGVDGPLGIHADLAHDPFEVKLSGSKHLVTRWVKQKHWVTCWVKCLVEPLALASMRQISNMQTLIQTGSEWSNIRRESDLGRSGGCGFLRVCVVEPWSVSHRLVKPSASASKSELIVWSSAGQ